jgi:hypothetical protein
MPPSVDEWLPQKHLACFVVEAVDGLDPAAMSKSYRGSDSASYHPKVVPSILIYGYATGVFSSCKLERATYNSVAFRFIAADDHPDHDTIANFRRGRSLDTTRHLTPGTGRRSSFSATDGLARPACVRARITRSRWVAGRVMGKMPSGRVPSQRNAPAWPAWWQSRWYASPPPRLP